MCVRTTHAERILTNGTFFFLSMQTLNSYGINAAIIIVVSYIDTQNVFCLFFHFSSPLNGGVYSSTANDAKRAADRSVALTSFRRWWYMCVFVFRPPRKLPPSSRRYLHLTIIFCRPLFVCSLCTSYVFSCFFNVTFFM